MMVRAKFKCVSVTNSDTEGGKRYFFDAAVEGEENKSWSKWTPSGRLEVTITNPDAQKFEAGKCYYLDFSPAE